MTSNVQIPTLDGKQNFGGYIAQPTGTAQAAIIVIQEVFGINAGMRQRCDAWAAEGYVALAPDLFWRIRPGIELDPDVPEQMQEALGYLGQYDADDGVRDIEAAIHWLRREQGLAKVGCVGFCLGGKLAYMAATRTDVSASVGYYPVGIDQMLNESHSIAHPLLLHIAKADGFVSPAAQQAIHEGLEANAKVTLYDYEGLDHGFATESGARRNDAGAQLADQRTRAFLAEHLA